MNNEQKIKSKKCGTNCPNCMTSDEDNVTFGKIVCEDIIYQPAKCLICGCEFKMYFEYSNTEFDLEQCKRVPCPYPLSEFFSTMDEIPSGYRVSDIEDCKNCDDEECGTKHCLIKFK